MLDDRAMRRLLVLSAAAAALATASCGRRATQADCDVILDRMVVVKLKARHVTDQPSIEKMQKELRTTAAADFPGCVGRRITDSAMACIKKAETQEAIVKCLR